MYKLTLTQLKKLNIYNAHKKYKHGLTIIRSTITLLLNIIF